MTLALIYLAVLERSFTLKDWTIILAWLAIYTFAEWRREA